MSELFNDPGNFRYRIFANIGFPAVHSLFKIDVLDLDKFPVEGPGIIVANHQSYLDIPAIATMVKRRRLFYKTCWVIGKSTAKLPFLKYIFSFCPLIIVNGTVRKAESALKRGHFVNIFPEGYFKWVQYKLKREGKDSNIKPKLGNSAAILALKTGFPIIPVGIRGSENLMPPYCFKPKRGTITVRVGDPFRFPIPEPEDVTEELLAEKTAYIMKRVDALR